MAKQIPEITLTMLLNVDSGASLKQALPESEKFLKKLKTNLDTHMKDMISEEAMADALTNGVKNAVDQLNQQLKTFGLNQLDAKNFLGSAAPFEEIGKVYGQTLADAFKNQFGQSMNGVVDDVLSKLDAMGKYGSRTIEQLRAAGERYLKVTEKGNKTADSSRIDKAIGATPRITIKDKTNKINDSNVDKAVKALISRYDNATKSNFGNKWEQQYAADVDFIKYYQGLAETLQRNGRSIESAFKGQPELFAEINSVFNSLVGTLQDKVNMLSNVREYNPFNPTQFTHGYDTGEPWAREQTLQEVKNILANGIKVDAKIEGNNDVHNTTHVSKNDNLTMSETDKAKNRNITDSVDTINAETEALREQNRVLADNIKIKESQRPQKLSQVKGVSSLKEVLSSSKDSSQIVTGIKDFFDTNDFPISKVTAQELSKQFKTPIDIISSDDIEASESMLKDVVRRFKEIIVDETLNEDNILQQTNSIADLFDKIAEITAKAYERFAYIDTNTGITTDYIESESGAVTAKDRKKLLQRYGEESGFNSTFHTHPNMDVATFSDDDLKVALKEFDNFKKHFVMAGEEISTLDLSSIDKSVFEKIVKKYTALSEDVDADFTSEPLGNFKAVTEDSIKNFISEFVEDIDNLEGILRTSKTEVIDERKSWEARKSARGDSYVHDVSYKQLKDFDISSISESIKNAIIQEFTFDNIKDMSVIDIEEELLPQMFEKIFPSDTSGQAFKSLIGRISNIFTEELQNFSDLTRDFENMYQKVLQDAMNEAISTYGISPENLITKQSKEEFISQYPYIAEEKAITVEKEKQVQLDDELKAKEEDQKRIAIAKAEAERLAREETAKQILDSQKSDDTNINTTTSDDSRVAISLEGVKELLESVVYNTKIIQDSDTSNSTLNNKSDIADNLSPENLKGILEGIIYNIKDTQEDTQMPWGREDTLNGIKGIVENINQLLISNPDDIKQFNYEGLAEALNGVTLKSSIESGENFNTTEEISQMSALEQEIQKVSEAVRAKTEAFVLEEQQVRQGVGKEISALNQLESKLISIAGILTSMGKIPTPTININNKNFVAERKKTTGTISKEPYQEGTINHKQTVKELGENKSLVDYYFWIEEEIKQYQNNAKYVAELTEVQKQLVPKMMAFYKEYQDKEMPQWYDSLNQKHTLHMARIEGGQEYTKSVSTENKALNILKDEYKIRKDIFNLEQQDVSEERIAPLREMLGIYQEIRKAIESTMTDSEMARYGSRAADIQKKEEYNLQKMGIKAESKADTEAANAQLKERNDIIKQLGNAYEKYGEVYQNALNYEGSNLGDYFEQEAANAEQKVNQLIDELHNITGADFNSDWVTNARKRIDIGSERANSAYGKSSAQRADTEAEAAARKANAAAMKEETKAITDIKSQYQELARVEAQLDTATRRGASTEEVAALQKSKQELEDIISVKLKDAGLDAKVFDTAKLEAYNKKLRQINEAEARRADRKTFKQAVEDVRIDAGTSQTKSVINKSNNTLLNAMTNVGQASQDNTSKIENFYNRVQELQDKLTDFNRAGDLVTEQDKDDLREQTKNVNILNAEITKMMQQYEQLSGDNVQVLGANTLGNSANIQDYKVALTQMVKTATNGRATITGFDATTKTLTYTMKGAGHETTSFSATLRDLDNSFVTVEGTTKKAETLIDSIKRKTSEILTYFTGSSVIYKAVAEVRKGITYVQEIDTALTELKKVTDETEETYDRFLDTASKTASKVGTTIKDIVNSTADWARLNI